MKRYNQLLCLTVVTFHMFVCYGRDISVVIASQSSQKIAAVQQAFSIKFPHDQITYRTCVSDSGIANQPVGYDCALQGVRNRFASVPQELLPADYVVAIENYIEQSPVTKRCYDKGLVLIKQGQQEMVLTTMPTYIPQEFVDLAQQLSDDVCESGYTTTVGCAIQYFFADRQIDPSDWHHEPEFGGVSRQQLLQDALRKILFADQLEYIKSFVTFYSNFPKLGITFANFLPILNDAQAFCMMIDLLVQRYQDRNITAIVGLESRGFIHGAALAHALGIRFVPVRKPGKLPGATYSVSYAKEYGFDTLVIAQDALTADDRVLIIDDLIATGGSARAAIELVSLTGAQPVEFASVLQVAELQEQVALTIPRFNLID